MRDCNANKDYITRLKRIDGQIKGIITMVEDNRPCEELAMQLLAVQNAVKNVGKLVVKNHLSHCVKEGIENGDENVVKEFCSILDKYI